jgi:nucleoid DNA-binding protein
VTKNEVTDRLARKLGVSPSEAEQIVETVGNVLHKVLLHDGKIPLQSFGTFGTRTNPQRKIRSEKNKKWYVTERNNGPYFKPSRELKQLA